MNVKVDYEYMQGLTDMDDIELQWRIKYITAWCIPAMCDESIKEMATAAGMDWDNLINKSFNWVAKDAIKNEKLGEDFEADYFNIGGFFEYKLRDAIFENDVKRFGIGLWYKEVDYKSCCKSCPFGRLREEFADECAIFCDGKPFIQKKDKEYCLGQLFMVHKKNEELLPDYEEVESSVLSYDDLTQEEWRKVESECDARIRKIYLY